MLDGVTVYPVLSSVVSTDTPNTNKEHKGTGPAKDLFSLFFFFENHHPTITESLKGGNTLLMEIAVMYGVPPDSWCTLNLEPTRFELVTSCLQSRCSSQLS